VDLPLQRTKPGCRRTFEERVKRIHFRSAQRIWIDPRRENFKLWEEMSQ
jgi:hypothetical protein